MTPSSKGPSGSRALLTVVAIGAGFLIVVLLARGAFQASLNAPPPAPAAAPPPTQVAVGGVTLISASIALPDDDQQYPKGPGADLMNNNCTACHSASMALNQPRLSADEWKGEVEKMRGTYKATVADKDVPGIVQYLTDLSGRLEPGRALGQTSSPRPPLASG